MKILKFSLIFLLILGIFTIYTKDNKIATSNGISYPKDWKSWKVVAVSYRTDNNTIRVILGNDVAIKSINSGKTNPWLDGSILAKVVWKTSKLEAWQSAIVPDKFVHVEFMFKDSKKYKKTGGWGWARWLGTDLKPFNKGPQSCIACHQPVKDRDLVFTKPAKLP